MVEERRLALVTGGARGIGAAIASALRHAGTDVVVLDREASREHRFLACDLTDRAALDSVLAELGRSVSILVQNAGLAESAPLARTTDAMWDTAFAVNVTAAFRVARALVPGMVAAGWGRVVHVASVAGLLGQPYVSAYCASKHALVGLTQALAAEVAGSGVTVNAVCPAFVDTEMTARTIDNIAQKTGRTKEQARESLEEMSPQHRLVTPDEVAATVAFLCSEAAASVHGQAIAIDGGQTTLTPKRRRP